MDVYSVSLNISAVSFGATQETTRPHQFRAAMDAAAKVLGLQPADLLRALKDGQSLADLAKSKGVSQDDLVKAMASAIGQANTNLSADQATQIATRMATGVPAHAVTGASGSGASNVESSNVGAARGHHHHHHHGGGGNDLMSAVSQLLGDTTDQVAAALQGGQSLADLAKSKGVSQDDLVQAVATALQKDNPNLSTDLATEIATEFATASRAVGSQVNVVA
jgi:lambda repressor-like predicted transcriptional regulator